MSDRDLERLKELPVPPPREAAKAAALAAARAAFAVGRIEARDPTPVSSLGEVSDLAHGGATLRTNFDPTYAENSITATQGVPGSARQTNASSTTRGRNRMRSNHYAAMAASFAAICAAVPSMMYFTKPKPQAVSEVQPQLVLTSPMAAQSPSVVAALPTPAPVEPTKPNYPTASGNVPVGASKNLGADNSSYLGTQPTATDKLREASGEQKPTPDGMLWEQIKSQQLEQLREVQKQLSRPTDARGPAKSAAPAAAPARTREIPTAAAPSPAANAVPPQQATSGAGVRAGIYVQDNHQANNRLGFQGSSRETGGIAAKTTTNLEGALEGIGIARHPGAVGSPVQRQAHFAAPSPREFVAPPHIDQGRDRFEAVPDNPVKQVAVEPVSTFSLDVDTASYSFVRRSLNAGRLPPKDAVRVEEMINYFPYAYARPESAAEPFQANVQVFPSPWNASNQLVHIGLKGYDLKSAERPRANLVFLVDISGSMAPADRLPLLKNSFRMLLDNLRPNDTVAIVTYASGSDIRLRPTRVADKARIIAAIDSLDANGSTHGAAGINDAYRVAEANFDKKAVNRVILATDGDWNVGITDRGQLKSFIERKRETGIFLSILGVGMGNHNDALMQTLAQSGNGAAAYIDTLSEARKVLVDEASSTLFPIAKDVKIQLEFNPARVSEYRLIGYESRMLRREDFNNDKVDAGDVGSGHSVTAIYEITPVDTPVVADGLRYQHSLPARGDSPAGSRPPRADDARAPDAKAGEIGFLKLRYKLPKEEASRLATFVIGPAQTKRAIAEASTEARFATAVAAFGQLLRGGTHLQRFGYDDVIALANGAKGEDAFGYRAEFVNLARLAKTAAPSVAPR